MVRVHVFHAAHDQPGRDVLSLRPGLERDVGDLGGLRLGERAHRAHAIIEQFIVDLKNGPLAHLPSGRFPANSASLVCATMAFNLTRSAGALASGVHARATAATMRAQLINVRGRRARSARQRTLRLPAGWSWEHAWLQLYASSTGPPVAARPTRRLKAGPGDTWKPSRSASHPRPGTSRSARRLSAADQASTRWIEA
jgi:hypothetical protein